jgi:hypothetical protein
VQVLAGLIRHSNVLGDGHRHVRPEDAAALRGSGDRCEVAGRKVQWHLAFAGEVACSSGDFVARLGVSRHFDAVQFKRLLECVSGKLCGILHGHCNVQSTRGSCAPGTHQQGTGAALEAREGFLPGCGNSHPVVDRVVIHVRHPLGLRRAGRGRVGGDVQLVGVVVEGERGDGRADSSTAYGPSSSPADTARSRRKCRRRSRCHPPCARPSVPPARQAGPKRPSQFSARKSANPCGSWWRGSGLNIRVTPRADGGIAHAEQHQVAMERAVRIHIAIAGHEGGPRQRVHRQQRKRRGGGRQFRIGARRKQPRVIQSVERLPVESGYADAKVRVTQSGVGENGLDAIGERARPGHAQRSVLWMTACLGGGLCAQTEAHIRRLLHAMDRRREAMPRSVAKACRVAAYHLE